MVEIFHPKKSNVDHLLVTYIKVEKEEYMEKMIVEYRGSEHWLLWNDHTSMYEGKINGLEGYVL
jgi:hypothetical protein